MTLWKQTYCKLIAFYWFTFGIAKGFIQSLRCDLLFLSWPKHIWQMWTKNYESIFRTSENQENSNPPIPLSQWIPKKSRTLSPHRSPSDLQAISKHQGCQGGLEQFFPQRFRHGDQLWKAWGLGLAETWHPGSQHGTENWWKLAMATSSWGSLGTLFSLHLKLGETSKSNHECTFQWWKEHVLAEQFFGSCMLSCIAAVVNCCDFGWKRSIVFK